MKRILFISGLYPPLTRGGAEVSTHLLAVALARRGWVVEVLAEGFDSEEVVDGVRVYRRKIGLTRKPLFERWHAKKMARVVRAFLNEREKYDIIHAHDFRAVQALSQLSVPRVVATVRDYAQICGSPNNLLSDWETCPGCEDLDVVWRNMAVQEASLIRKPFRAWQYWFNIGFRLESFRTIKTHIYISRAQLEEVKKRQDLSGITTRVIYNPVQAEFLESPVKPSRSGVILFVGTMETYKGVGVLLDAFEKLSEQKKEVELRLAGAGAQLEEYKRRVFGSTLNDRVKFMGRVSNNTVMSLYDEAEVVVAPHVWVEPFGRTTVEGMARGKVVVAANVGGPAEVIQDGVTGVLFERGNANDLADKLVMVLNWEAEKKQQIGEVARDWVKENLGPERIAEEYEEVYGSLIRT